MPPGPALALTLPLTPGPWPGAPAPGRLLDCPGLALARLALAWPLAVLAARRRRGRDGRPEARGAPRQVAVRRDSPAAPVSDSPSRSSADFAPGGVALGEALGRVAEGRPGGAVGLRGRRLEAGELSSQVALLLRGHRVELVAEVLEVVAGLLRVAVAVRIRLARGRARQRPAQRGQRRRPLFVRRVDLGANAGLDRAQLREVRVEVVRVFPQLASEVAQFCANLVRGSFASLPLAPRSSATFWIFSAWRSAALGTSLLLGDHRLSCGFGRIRDRARARSGGDRGRRPAAGRETARALNRAAGAERSDGRASRRWRRTNRRSPRPLRRGRRRPRRASLFRLGRRAGRRRERDRELEGARDPVAEAAFGVDGERGLPSRGGPGRRRPASPADPRPGWHRRSRPPPRGGQEPGAGPQDQLGDKDRGDGDPARRTMRRIHRRRAGAAAPARSASSDGSSGAPRSLRVGRDDRRSPGPARPAEAARAAANAHRSPRRVRAAAQVPATGGRDGLDGQQDEDDRQDEPGGHALRPDRVVRLPGAARRSAPDPPGWRRWDRIRRRVVASWPFGRGIPGIGTARPRRAEDDRRLGAVWLVTPVADGNGAPAPDAVASAHDVGLGDERVEVGDHVRRRP